MSSFTKKEISFLKKLNTPAKVQDYLNSLAFNFEHQGETLMSPLRTMRAKKAHCFEGALLGAYILSLHNIRPFILHLKAINGDYDHVITPFKVGKFWGALSKTNHVVLRYREPIYKNVRELCMTYFHEYFLNSGVKMGQKTLRQYSVPLNLNTLAKFVRRGGGWETNKEDLWYIDKKLDQIKHYDIVPKNYIKKLRKAEKIEIKTGKIVEWKK